MKVKNACSLYYSYLLAIQMFKKLRKSAFFIHFSCPWIWIRISNPDPLSHWIRIRIHKPEKNLNKHSYNDIYLSAPNKKKFNFLPHNCKRDEVVSHLHWLCSCLEWRVCSSERDGLSGLRTSVLRTVSVLLGLAELAMEKTPESAWLAGESLLLVSRGDSARKKECIINKHCCGSESLKNVKARK
jgi:hypothetical protein